MPGPISLPFLGSAINFMLQRKVSNERPVDFIINSQIFFHSTADSPLLYVQNLSRKYESFCVWVGSNLHVIVTKVEDIDLVLSSSECINRADFARFFILDAIGAESIFTLEGGDF